MTDLTPQFQHSAEHSEAVRVGQEDREDCMQTDVQRGWASLRKMALSNAGPNEDIAPFDRDCLRRLIYEHEHEEDRGTGREAAE